MTTAGFLWPTKDEYDLAIARWQDTIFDPEVRGGQLAFDTMGICRFGGANLYVCVYKIGNWMVRCFCSKPSHAAPVDICERYRAIDRFCRKNADRVSGLLPVTYLEQGIIVGTRTMPMVKMPYLTGCPSLGEFIMDNYTNRTIMQQLSDAWFRMIRELEMAPMAHGDLDLSNVLVERGDAWNGLTLKLIDYDNMWMPELAGRTQTEYGHANFQHPDFLPPRQRPYSVEMDRFSALVMYISLKALSVHPELYDAWGADESDRLLLAESDYPDAGLVGSHIMQLHDLCSPDMHPYIGELQSCLRESRMPRSLNDLANANSSTFISYRPPTTPRLQPPPSFSAPVFKWSEAVYNANTSSSYPLQGQTGGRGYATNYNGHTGQVQQQVQQPLQHAQSQNVAWNSSTGMQSPAIIRSGQPTHQFPESDSGLTYPASWGPQNPSNSPFSTPSYNSFSTPPTTPFSTSSMSFIAPVRNNTPLPIIPTTPTKGKSKIITTTIIVVLVLVIIAASIVLYMVLTGNHHIGPLSLIAGLGYWGMGRKRREFKGDEYPPLEDVYPRKDDQFSSQAPLEDGRPHGQWQFFEQPPVRGIGDGRPQEQSQFFEQPPIRGIGDGRPQGAPPIHPTPVPTMQRCRFRPDIVGTGVGRMWGVAPCGRPSSFCERAGTPCGRPSSSGDSLYVNSLVPCERPSSNCASFERGNV